MPAQEYGCNHCRTTFTRPKTDKPKEEANVRCPHCRSGDIEKFDTRLDKFRFFRRMAFSGG